MLQLIRSLSHHVPGIKGLIAHRNDLLADNEALKKQLSLLSTTAKPSIKRQIDQLCSVVDPAHYVNAEWLSLHNDLSRYSGDKHCFQNFSGEIYRKGWEWTHCLYGLGKLGMLQPTHRALGVGVGRECVIYYLADQIAAVTATDLYGEAAWSSAGGKEADLTLLEESKAHCPATVDFSKISFQNQDGTKLSYENDLFDFAWSLSSIEHFGGHGAALKAMQEMARVVRPGGIVAIATEMMLLEEYAHPEYFKRSELIRDLIEPCSDLELVEPINFHTLPYEYIVDSIVVPAGVDRRRRHVVLNDGQVQWTSILMFFRVLF